MAIPIISPGSSSTISVRGMCCSPEDTKKRINSRSPMQGRGSTRKYPVRVGRPIRWARVTQRVRGSEKRETPVFPVQRN